MSTETASTNGPRSETLDEPRGDGAHAVPFAAVDDVAVSAQEINEPLMAIMANAAACLRWLTRTDPNLDQARLAAERIIGNCRRASDLARGTRAVLLQSTSKKAALDASELTD